MRNVVRLQQKVSNQATIGELIERYKRVRAVSRPLGESHICVMDRMMEMDIGQKVAAELESSDIIALAQTLREGDGIRRGVGASTVGQYIMALRGPLKYAAPGWGMKDVSDKALKEAKPLLDQLQLSGKSRPRDRRPTPPEWGTLHGHFVVQDQLAHTRIKMAIAMDFALGSLRRRGEIVRLKWEHFEDDPQRPMMTILDMKDPKYKKGNHHRFPLLYGTADIIRAMPMVDEYIFPWNGKSLGKRFIDAKKLYNIIDLRFHDIRRHGICNMLEQGFSPAQVAAVSGHKNWNTLARVYGASTRPEDVHAGPAGAQRSRDEAEKLQREVLPVEEEAE